MAFDVNESDFQARVIERSREVPVVVDFWAEWCGPCRVLGPALEDAVAKRAGEVELAKVDVDQNNSLAASFGIRGIPAVKAFRDGQVVDEFTGAIPPAQIEQFLARIVPSPADRLAAADDEESLRKALELEPRNAAAARKLGRLLLERGDASEALAAARRRSGRLRGRRPRGARAPDRPRSASTGPTGPRLTRPSRAASPPGTRASWSKPSRASRRRSSEIDDPELARPGAPRDGGDLHRARRGPPAGQGASAPAGRRAALSRD